MNKKQIIIDGITYVPLEEEKPWPQKGDRYFSLSPVGGYITHMYHDNEEDRKLIETGNFYKTAQRVDAKSNLLKHIYKFDCPEKCDGTCFFSVASGWSVEKFRYSLLLLRIRYEDGTLMISSSTEEDRAARTRLLEAYHLNK